METSWKWARRPSKIVHKRFRAWPRAAHRFDPLCIDFNIFGLGQSLSRCGRQSIYRPFECESIDDAVCTGCYSYFAHWIGETLIHSFPLYAVDANTFKVDRPGQFTNFTNRKKIHINKLNSMPSPSVQIEVDNYFDSLFIYILVLEFNQNGSDSMFLDAWWVNSEHSLRWQASKRTHIWNTYSHFPPIIDELGISAWMRQRSAPKPYQFQSMDMFAGCSNTTRMW